VIERVLRSGFISVKIGFDGRVTTGAKKIFDASQECGVGRVTFEKVAKGLSSAGTDIKLGIVTAIQTETYDSEQQTLR